jgi:squalene-hopene/tetraprenyl-beta-curcumene cyclase
MNLQIDVERLCAAQETVRSALIAERTMGGHWVGELGSSPLATATAISALTLAHASRPDERDTDWRSPSAALAAQHVLQNGLSELIVESLHWLAQRQNEDGGWGDTEHGRSNLAATLLVASAFRLTGVPAKYTGLMERAEQYIDAQGGVAALKRCQGRDRTMSAPVLANAALAGLVPWRQVPALPFELACFPQHWYPRLRLPVVSCAVPVLVAVGQLKYRHDPPRNPAVWLARFATRKTSLAVLSRMQPQSGGFLEATPLTAFVVMSLAAIGLVDHPVVMRGIEFLLETVRSDGSWPIDTNLATWNTTLAMNALASDSCPSRGKIASQVPDDSSSAHFTWHDTVRSDDLHVDTIVMNDAPHDSAPHTHFANDSICRADTTQFDEKCIDWLLSCQRFDPDPSTAASPGGWSWTDRAGGVPDADDTAGALLALAHWRDKCPSLKRHRLQLAARHGVEWLLDLQNSDGGWPTFCSGWNALPFDRSANDPTAHTIRALAVWQHLWDADPSALENHHYAEVDWAALGQRIASAIERGCTFLEQQQRNDGSFVPLWFGNQHHPEGHNLVYGTARVLSMCAELDLLASDMAQRAARWLLGVQHANGGWGPPRSSPATSLSNIYRPNAARAEDALAGFCSIEETSLAVAALMPLAESNPSYARSVQNGLNWLVEAIEQGRYRQAAPIGFYFAKLWYHERLYPLVFATGTLNQAIHQLAPQRSAAVPVS